MSETARVKYVYLDIVGFTKDRSVEAQIDVIAGLNEVVRSALTPFGIELGQAIFLPTGDGIAVALLNVEPFDAHLKIALEILRLTSVRNAEVSDVMRQFIVRIGINENVDNLVIDINGKENVAGNGISIAQRIMDMADGGQIIIGQTVYETLRPRERYMKSFRKFSASTKHGTELPVYQFLDPAPGLNVEVPSVFKVEKRAPPRLTKLAAYFIAHAAQVRPFLISEKNDFGRDVVATVVLFFLAHDSEKISDTPSYVVPRTFIWKGNRKTFEEHYQHYKKAEYILLIWLSDFLSKVHLDPFSSCFESDGYLTRWVFISDKGIQKLRIEWPEIADEFGITD